MDKKNKISIGTRGSQLALWQANWVKEIIIKNHPEVVVELIIIKTKGDKILDIPLAKIGGKGLFIKEIEEALLRGRIDIAVHSMKDMPAEIPKGLCIGAIPKREDSRDVLICRRNFCFSKAKGGARIGTSSLRRASQLLYLRPDIEIIPVRGNLETRINKLETQKLDAVVLAAAGLIRLGLKDRISQFLDVEIMLPAVGQGALCVEFREENLEISRMLASIDDKETRCTVLAERAFLLRLDGGCQVPIAANAVLELGQITLTGLVASVDGSKVIKKTLYGSTEYAEQIGTELAESLLSLGAANILL